MRTMESDLIGELTCDELCMLEQRRGMDLNMRKAIKMKREVDGCFCNIL